MLFKKKKTKIFCIGNNKTGTTSLEKFFKDHNYDVAPQREAENLIDSYIQRDWKPLVNYVKQYEVFQDFPFSYAYTYLILDYIFPNSKFILSVRDDSEQWYKSVLKFHTKLFSKNNTAPTKKDLQNATYIEKGWIWKSFSEKYGDFQDAYNKERLISYYENYNSSVRNYFKNNKNFLEVNVGEDGTIQKLGEFLDIKTKYTNFPHENKTKK